MGKNPSYDQVWKVEKLTLFEKPVQSFGLFFLEQLVLKYSSDKISYDQYTVTSFQKNVRRTLVKVTAELYGYESGLSGATRGRIWFSIILISIQYWIWKCTV